MLSGMDPNYMITFNGRSNGEKAVDLLQYYDLINELEAVNV
jgi:hypothetical protein